MINTFRCIIIDDEDHAIGLLTESLKSLYPNIEIAGAYSSWKDGLQAIRTQNADIIFLDISLDGKSGMDLLNYAPAVDSEIIFITAYTEYALEAFKFSATGYIVKPIKDEQLSVAVNKAIERIKHKRLASMNADTTGALQNKIGIPGNNGIDYINVKDIMYFEAVQGYTKVVTINGDILTSYRIGKFKKIQYTNSFFQVHRSYIVNPDYILRYNSTGMIILKNKTEVPVARNMRDEFLRLFNTVSGKDKEGE